jgi:hypothetical protein
VCPVPIPKRKGRIFYGYPAFGYSVAWQAVILWNQIFFSAGTVKMLDACILEIHGDPLTKDGFKTDATLRGSINQRQIFTLYQMPCVINHSDKRVSRKRLYYPAFDSKVCCPL